MRVLRIVGLSLVAVLAAFFAFQAFQVSTPSTMSVNVKSDGLDSLISAALANYDINAENTDNVYQQQVVAAWGVKDLVEVTARQNAVVIENQAALGSAIEALATTTTKSAEANAQLFKSVVLLLFLIVVAVVVLGTTMLDRKPQVLAPLGPPTPPQHEAMSGPDASEKPSEPGVG